MIKPSLNYTPSLWLAVAILLTAHATQGFAQAPKETLAVLELGVVDGTNAQATAITNQLRADLLATGKVTLVDRAEIDAILDEQAFQQQMCTSQECAIEVGRILGVRKIVAGTITRVSERLWQVAVRLIDVETTETLRAEAYNHEGEFRTLLRPGMADVAAELTRNIGLSPEAVARAREYEARQASWKSTWRWLLGLGIASAAFSYYEAEQVRASNDEQKDILAKMDRTDSWTTYESLRRQLKSEEDDGDTHKTYSDGAFVVSAVLLGAAAWVYFDPPADDAAVTVLPLPLGPGVGGIVLAVRW